MSILTPEADPTTYFVIPAEHISKLAEFGNAVLGNDTETGLDIGWVPAEKMPIRAIGEILAMNRQVERAEAEGRQLDAPGTMDINFKTDVEDIIGLVLSRTAEIDPNHAEAQRILGELAFTQRPVEQSAA